uniref:Uncharacterized protein n=1 Tax=Tanacetum cinerariifolium TaxID=118510 RepID=A0A6L2N9T7_TANCI|nr:hypothetical protein [Tanacetum cinerariifolium]
MKRGFLSQKGSEGGRGIKEKDLNRNKKNTSSGIGVSTDSDDTINDVTSVGVASSVQEGIAPSVVDMTVEMEKRNTLDGRRWHNLLLTMSSYTRVMVELRADMELKDNIVMVMPKITREGHYTCNDTGVGVKKNVKKPSQTFRGVLVGPKMGFKPQKEYHLVLKKPNASSSSNKKKGVEPNIEVSNSNPFDILNSIDNDREFGTNGGTTNLVNNGSTSSVSSFMNIDNDGEFASNTLIGKKIDKIERQIGEGKLRLLDNDANTLVSTDGCDKGYGTNSLLEQWRVSYLDNDDYVPYDDDMYDNHDFSKHLQSICDDLDIIVRGRKKK